MRFLLFFTFFFFRQCRSISSVLKMRCERLRPFWPLINRKPLKKYSLISSSQSVTVTGARFDKNYRGDRSLIQGPLDGTTGKFRDFISEKGCLEGTSENFEKNKVQREKWPVPSNGPPCRLINQNEFQK